MRTKDKLEITTAALNKIATLLGTGWCPPALAPDETAMEMARVAIDALISIDHWPPKGALRGYNPFFETHCPICGATFTTTAGNYYTCQSATCGMMLRIDERGTVWVLGYPDRVEKAP